MPARSVSVAVLVVLVLSLAAVGVAARPPPKPLCGICDGSLAGSAANHDVSLAVARTDLSIDVDASGSSRWRVRFRLRSGADELAANGRRRRAIVRDAFGTGVRSRLAGETLVVTYPDADFARRSAGAVVVDSLTGPNRFLDADSLRIHAPTGYRLANHPTSGTKPNDSVAVWHGNGDDGYFEATYLAFVPTDAFAPNLAGPYAILRAVGPMLATKSLRLTLVPMLVLGGASALLTRWQGMTVGDERVSLVAALVAVVTSLAIVLGSPGLPDRGLVLLSVAVPAALFFGQGYHDRRDRRTWGFVAALAIAPFLVVFVLAIGRVTGPVFGDGFAGAFLDLGVVVALVVGVAAFFVGRAIARN